VPDRARKSPAIVLLRAAARAQPLEKVGGKGGINTRPASRCFLKKFSNIANIHTSRNTSEK